MLITDGHDVYEMDEESIKKHRVKREGKAQKKHQEKEQSSQTKNTEK